MATTRNTSITVVCQWCQNGFHPLGGRAQTMKYCSLSCRDKGRTKPIREMTDTEAAWLAGLFDGEGNILPMTILNQSKVRGLRITVTNTCRPLVDRVAEVTGVGFITTRYRQSERHKPTHDWHHTGRGAKQILLRIQPWLIAKYDQSVVAIGDPHDLREFTIESEGN